MSWKFIHLKEKYKVLGYVPGAHGEIKKGTEQSLAMRIAQLSLWAEKQLDVHQNFQRQCWSECWVSISFGGRNFSLYLPNVRKKTTLPVAGSRFTNKLLLLCLHSLNKTPQLGLQGFVCVRVCVCVRAYVCVYVLGGGRSLFSLGTPTMQKTYSGPVSFSFSPLKQELQTLLERGPCDLGNRS